MTKRTPMYYEMRTYTIKPGKMTEYLALFRDVGLPIISQYTTLVGFWYTEIGELNQVVHIWAYDSLDGRAQKRKELYQNPNWISDFVSKIMPMLEKQESKILLPAEFSPIK
ncbi:NIPSNAP family protein [Rhodospirillum sp. A1_3_36]|uniref:NIPSNAP family protein n=1 Tax=Rhodospirillum sp. A1_3_36 TaxID=3391666 RepID=UPI0039A4F2E4